MTKLLRKIEGRGHTTLVCPVCGKDFIRPNAHIRSKTQACSRACSAKIRPYKPKTLLSQTCNKCGVTFTVRKGRGGTGEYCSIQCMAVVRGKNMRGSSHPNWKNGATKRPYAVRKVIADILKTRKKCEECGDDKDLQGHHIKSYAKYLPERADPTNIQVLCRVCHAKKHPKLANLILSGGHHA